MKISLSLPAVALTELVDLFCGLQDVLLAGVKWMRLAGNFEFQQWIFVTVFPFDGFARGYGRTCQYCEFRRDILKYDVSILGVNILFHSVVWGVKVLKGANFDPLCRKVQVFFSLRNGFIEAPSISSLVAK